MPSGMVHWGIKMILFIIVLISNYHGTTTILNLVTKHDPKAMWNTRIKTIIQNSYQSLPLKMVEVNRRRKRTPTQHSLMIRLPTPCIRHRKSTRQLWTISVQLFIQCRIHILILRFLLKSWLLHLKRTRRHLSKIPLRHPIPRQWQRIQQLRRIKI